MLMLPKDAIAKNAYFAAKDIMQKHSASGYNGYGFNNSIMAQFSELIALAVEAGVREVLQNIYSNQEFEQDLGLQQKDH